MSSHSHRCIIHPQHNHVGVCALCLRERLVTLAESESSTALSCSSTASDGAFHSFSSSSARDHDHQQALSPAQPPASTSAADLHHHHHHHLLHQQQQLKHPPATSSSSSSTFLHKLKLKALISIPPSPERAISKNSAGLLYSPSPRSFHPKSKNIPPGRNSVTSELAAQRPLHHLPHANVPPVDRISAPSIPHVEGAKASLRSLFSQSADVGDAIQDTTEYSYSAAGFDDRTFKAPPDERRRRIEQFSAAMRSPGFAPSMSKADPCGECKQGYESGGENGSRQHASWIASLFKSKKQKGVSKSKRNAMATEVLNSAGNGTFEASARTSVDFARVSMDSASTAVNLKQIIRSRLQQEEAEAMKNAAGVQANHMGGRPPLAGKLHINSKLEQPQPAGNMNNSYEFPARSSISIGSTISVSGTRISSTSRLGVEGDKHSDGQDSNAPEPVRHFPRSRSWGRAWSRVQLPQSTMASPQHVLWAGSKQHLSNTSDGASNVKLSSVQHHFLTSTPKHPSMDTPALKDSRVGFGFYFSPFRRSKAGMKSERY